MIYQWHSGTTTCGEVPSHTVTDSAAPFSSGMMKRIGADKLEMLCKDNV